MACMLFPPLRRAGVFRLAVRIWRQAATSSKTGRREMPSRAPAWLREIAMPGRQTAPYGSWSSPITSDLIVASTIGLSGIQLDGADVYWLESRPQENGRSVIVRRAADGASADVTPPVAAA